MDTNLIITGVIAIILIFLIIKFAKNIIKVVLILIVIAAVAFYGFLHFNQISSMEDLHAKYCDSPDEKDVLKCEYIVKPVEDDFNKRFTKEESKKMSRLKFSYEILISAKNKREEIQENLKKKEKGKLLKEFNDDFWPLNYFVKDEN